MTPCNSNALTGSSSEWEVPLCHLRHQSPDWPRSARRSSSHILEQIHQILQQILPFKCCGRHVWNDVSQRTRLLEAHVFPYRAERHPQLKVLVQHCGVWYLDIQQFDLKFSVAMAMKGRYTIRLQVHTQININVRVYIYIYMYNVSPPSYKLVYKPE